MEKHRFDLDVMCNRITKKSQISSSTDSHSERYNHARDTRRFPRSLFDDFYIAGNKILLSCITNGVPCAVKIVRGTRNCCSRRASVLNGLLFEKIIARVRAAFRSRGCVQRGYADTIIIRFSDKVKSLPEKKKRRCVVLLTMRDIAIENLARVIIRKRDISLLFLLQRHKSAIV